MSDAPFGLSPSALARYFFHDCERFLRFRATSNPEKNGVPKREYDTGPVMKAVLECGHTWEREVLTNYLADSAKIAPGDGDITERIWSVEDSIKLLRDSKDGDYLYQITLRPPASFYNQLGLDKNFIEIRDNRPDLIKTTVDASGARRFQVIDVKRGASIRVPYRVQIMFYALELESILKEHAIDGTVDLDHGAAWLGGATAPEEFELEIIRAHLTDLMRKLPEMFARGIEDVHWHVCYKCEWCEYLEHCQGEMTSCNSVSRIAGLSANGKRFLKDELEVESLEDLATLLESPDVDERISHCASLAGDRPRLKARVDAFEKREPVVFGTIHPVLPLSEAIRIFITVQAEPVEDRTWLIGMLVNPYKKNLKDIFGTSEPPKPLVHLAETREETREIVKTFINELYEILERIDKWNRKETEWKNQVSVQFYCYSEQEKARLVRVLLESISDPDQELATRAGILLLQLHVSENLNGKKHSDTVQPCPLISLVSAAGRLLALPVDVSYTLPETSEALGSSFKVERNDSFYPFGHAMKSDQIFRAWNGQSINTSWIRTTAAFRLWAYSAILSKIRELAKPFLFAYPPKMQLLASAGIKHPELSRLAFLAQFESFVQFQALRDTRCQPREILEASGKLMTFTYKGGGSFTATSTIAELDDNTFSRWLVVRDDNKAMAEQAKFNDWSLRDKVWGGKQNPNYGIAKLKEVIKNEEGFVSGILVDWSVKFEPGLEIGEKIVLLPTFQDYNTAKSVAAIKEADEKRGLFVELLDNPGLAASKMEVVMDFRDAIDSERNKTPLTDSQISAWDKIVDHKVTAVWGPPGTGKTHFLAALIVGFCRASARTNRPCRILVTAMTHAAIENVLKKVVAFDRESELVVGKVRGMKSEAFPTVRNVEKKAVDEWLRSNRVSVLGSTVWGLTDSTTPFDIVIIDEASQLKVPDASIPLCRVAPTGRFVAAGDHFQLGPIVAGEYPEPPPGEPVLQASIFDLLIERPGRPGAPLCQLLENWRMCDVLTDASRILYGPDYICASTEVSSRRLHLARHREGLIKACLNPDHPLVLVVLDGLKGGKVNETEAKLVADLALALREDGTDTADDLDFWRERLFIVSPHHVQISAIRQALAGVRDWSAKPFVDTVEKMQGQEADSVIISYGVSDPEYAASEAEFIYSRNRLNVSITRARSKSIVFIPRPLIDATPEILDCREVTEGLGYMRDLANLARKDGTITEFSLEGGVSAEVIGLGTVG